MTGTISAPRRAAAAMVGLGLLLMAGCTPAGPTGYRALSGQYGYDEERTRDGTWQIVFYATPDTPRDRLENYILYRAAELAQDEGKPRFAVMEHGFQTLEEQRTISERPPPGFEVGGAGFGRGDTTLTREYEPPPSREPQIRLKADMKMQAYEGAPPPKAERLYETAQVLRQLGPAVRARPQ